MKTLRDVRGLAVSTPSTHALDRVEYALTDLLAGRGELDRHVDAALRHDPHCVLAHCLRISARLLGTDRADDASIVRALDATERIIHVANDRERHHVVALRAWAGGDRRTALEGYGALLVDYPRDTLALQLAHALDFRLGRRAELRDRAARALLHWQPGMPHLAYVLGMHAFGLVETGDYANAEAAARRSLAIAPDHAAAMHVIAHVLEMQGRARDGIAFLESTRHPWLRNPGFAIHIAWHLALFHIDLDAIDRALEIYDGSLRPSFASSTNALVDASALLWRLELRGAKVASRWRELAKCWRRRPLRGNRAFSLVHAAMAFVGAHRDRLARRVVEVLRDDAATRSANEAHELALALLFCEALRAFGRGDHGYAVECIATVRTRADRCGGSIAQCDLVHLTFLEAALRSRRAPLARALAAERTARKPQSLLNRWLFARAAATA
jgi:tetratricopeptide (TPR) repeat protein